MSIFRKPEPSSLVPFEAHTSYRRLRFTVLWYDSRLTDGRREMSERFDIIVVGGGHAGTEAAHAAARLGVSTALVTMDPAAIGRMSCNPSIGGLGKGQIVREIDALGGLMGIASDAGGIQFRTLNLRKGPAVQAPRAQADRKLYALAVQSLLVKTPNLTIIEGSVEDIRVKPDISDGHEQRITGVVLQDGRLIHSDVVILTTGTFLRGLMHCGERKTEGGRCGEPSAIGVSKALLNFGFEMGRLKTGTPPRVHRDSINYDVCETQPGDEYPTPFSFMTDALLQSQVCCWITYTNPQAHGHIKANLHRAPMYSGQIESTGPRYCPSIEDKIVRFADKPRHQVFLEPEGYDDERVYCNGIPTSLPRDVQDIFVKAIPGLEEADIVQYGYAIEYDWVPTHQTDFSLETKRVKGLYLAGQINGTSGYEEAAGQGLIAGVNAARSVTGCEPVILKRDEAYIGVMIDDLITKPHLEPYRMFTSRAEYRLMLRSDNADQRLTPLGRLLGLVDDVRWRTFETKQAEQKRLAQACTECSIDAVPVTNWARRPEASIEILAGCLGGNDSGFFDWSTYSPFCVSTLGQFLVESKYTGYLHRQNLQIERFRKLESMTIPESIDYAAMPELRLEAREKLARVAPKTLGQASRISGINPADLTILWVYASGKRSLRPAS